MDIPSYRIHHILRCCTDQFKYKNINVQKINKQSDTFHISDILSSDGWKHQLIDQITSKLIDHLAVCVQEKKGRRAARDSLYDLSDQDGKRKQHETLIQDSRR
jgi:hypothetical protein